MACTRCVRKSIIVGNFAAKIEASMETNTMQVVLFHDGILLDSYGSRAVLGRDSASDLKDFFDVNKAPGELYTKIFTWWNQEAWPHLQLKPTDGYKGKTRA